MIDPKTAAFDSERFYAALEAVRDHYGIENNNRLAQAIGIGHNVISRLRDGKGIEFESLIKVLAWSQLDLRKYVVDASVSSGSNGTIMQLPMAKPVGASS